MSRMRTHRSKKYFQFSNCSAQDETLSFEALGMLTYCLSMPEDWNFCPKIIWKKRNCGRKAVYDMFNELIQTFHCIRIRIPNPKAKNLPGEIDYEIFDDVEDCKARILELEKEDLFIEHADNFKKSFRHSNSWDTELRDTENWNNTKETNKTNKNISTKSSSKMKSESVACPSDDDASGGDDDACGAGVVSSLSQDLSGEAGDLVVTKTNGQQLTLTQSVIYRYFLKKDFDTDVVREAIKRTRSNEDPINNPLKYLESVCASIVRDNQRKPAKSSKNSLTKTKNHKSEYHPPKEEEPFLAKSGEPLTNFSDYFPCTPRKPKKD